MALVHSEFSLAFSRALGKVVVHVHGAVDARTAVILRQRLADLVLAQGNLSVVLDLRDMPVIHEGGLDVLTELHGWLESKGGELVLSGPRPGPRRQLESRNLGACINDATRWAHPAYGRREAEGRFLA